MGRRTILIIALGFVVVTFGLIGAFLAFSDGGSSVAGIAGEGGAGLAPPDPETGAAVATRPQMVEVVVSLQTLPRGWQITEEDIDQLITTEMQVASSVNENVFLDVEDVIGMYARTDIFQGQTLTQNDLVSDPTLIGEEDYGPSSLIPPGAVAMALPMDRLSSVAYGLQPGDSVDVLITFSLYQIDEDFQTYLQNTAVFFLETVVGGSEEGGGEESINLFSIPAYGRFESLPTGDRVHISPSDVQFPAQISILIQNAKTIHVGDWTPPDRTQVATPTPPPAEEGQPTPTPAPIQVTPTPVPPDVLLIALSPQQQLLLKYAIEAHADIDFALRGAGDNQIYTLEQVDLDFLIERFNFEIPPNIDVSAELPPSEIEATATPAP